LLVAWYFLSFKPGPGERRRQQRRIRKWHK